MGPKILVLSGRVAMERSKRLMAGMINASPNLHGFGEAVVNLLSLDSNESSRQADILQPYLKQFVLRDGQYKADPGFDERVMFEAVTFAAKMFKMDWLQQVRPLNPSDYRFERWSGDDLVLSRR